MDARHIMFWNWIKLNHFKVKVICGSRSKIHKALQRSCPIQCFVYSSISWLWMSTFDWRSSIFGGMNVERFYLLLYFILLKTLLLLPFKKIIKSFFKNTKIMFLSYWSVTQNHLMAKSKFTFINVSRGVYNPNIFVQFLPQC